MSAVLYESSGGVATLTLSRPERLNAMRREDYDRLVAAIDRAEADRTARVLVLTGAGRAFCAGTDLSDGFDLPAGGDPATGRDVPADLGGRVTLRLFRCRKPVIAAINGAAVGFGASLALPADFRLAATGARFGFVFSRRGIAADGCSSWFLPRIVGLPRAADWLLTGRMIEAGEALAAGLVSRLVDPDRLMAEARGLAEDLARTASPLSLAVNRRLLWLAAGLASPHEAHRLESRAMAATLAGPDPAEGAAAFQARRAPVFTTDAADADFLDAWRDPEPFTPGPAP